jgi:hypothetical protein
MTSNQIEYFLFLDGLIDGSIEEEVKVGMKIFMIIKTNIIMRMSSIL